MEQVLKLYYYLREMEGKKNRWVSRAEVVNMVAGQVVKLWYMAGFQTVKMYNVVKSLTKEVEKYELIQKARSKTSEVMELRRKNFLENIKKLFDISSPDLEDVLTKSRILGNDDDCTRYREETGYTRKTEDLSFLVDQRGERKTINKYLGAVINTKIQIYFIYFIYI